MNVQDYEWIGIVYPGDVHDVVAFITPLAFYNEDINAWELISPDVRRQCFSNNGKAAIFVKDYPRSKTDRLYRFWPQLNATIKDPESPRTSHYLASSDLEPAPFAQVFDWTTSVSNAYDLPDLLEKGIEENDWFCHCIYIRYQDYLYGPISIEIDARSSKGRPIEYVKSSSTGGDTLIVSRYTLPNAHMFHFISHSPRSLFLDESSLGSPLDAVDWSLPQTTIKQILKASNSALADLEENARLVDKRVRDLARMSSSDGPYSVRINLCILERAQYILTYQMERLRNLRALIEELPAGHPLLCVAREQEIEKRSAEIARNAEMRAQVHQERLPQLEKEVRQAEAQLTQLKGDIVDAGKQREQALQELSAFEQEVQKRIQSLREEPLRALAELQLTASFFQALGGNIGTLTNGQREQQQPYIPHNHPSTIQQPIPFEGSYTWRPHGDAQEIKNGLHELTLPFWSQAAKQAGVPSKDVRACAAALLAGLVPATWGPAAIAVPRAVAQVIAAGCVSVIPVPVTALSPLDLFGAINSSRRRFVPTASGLADYILQAWEHRHELALVILEGIDRVPGMPVYVPLLRQYIEVQQYRTSPVQSEPINLFHPSALVADDPYRVLAQFTWPSNLLLAVTLDRDTISIPLPSVCAPWFVRKKSSQRSSTQPPSTSTPTYVSFEHWQAWKQHIYHQAAISTDKPEGPDYRQQAFWAALTMLKFEKSEAEKILEDNWPQLFLHASDKDVQEKQ